MMTLTRKAYYMESGCDKARKQTEQPSSRGAGPRPFNRSEVSSTKGISWRGHLQRLSQTAHEDALREEYLKPRWATTTGCAESFSRWRRAEAESGGGGRLVVA